MDSTQLADGQATMVRVGDLQPNPYQPRVLRDDHDVSSLAESIRTSGMIQPISVRRRGERLEIIAGERRWRAAQVAGLDTVPVIVRNVDDQAMLEMALVENLQREDLNAVERAKAYDRYCDQFQASAEQLAVRLAEDRTTVTNYLRILDLPDDILDLLAAGRLTMGHARCIVGVGDDETRRKLARSTVANSLSVRALEDLVRRQRQRGESVSETPTRRADKSPHVRDLEQRLSVAVGTKVTVQEGRRKGSGRLVIEYYSLDDFDRITDHLGLTPE